MENAHSSKLRDFSLDLQADVLVISDDLATLGQLGLLRMKESAES